MNAQDAADLQKRAGPMSGRNVVGETTEALHRFLLDGWTYGGNPPRIEEDLKFVPKDREEVLYVYMYRLAQNTNLQNQRRLRRAPVFVKDDVTKTGEVYYHRPPLVIDVFYLICVHSKFRSDAERLLGWLLLRLNDATHLIYRPRRFLLPDGREVDSLGRTYDVANLPHGGRPRVEIDATAEPAGGVDPSDVMPTPEDAETEADHDGLHIEKISLALVDDLTVGDAINLFTLHEAPFRPFLTYRARMAIDGSLYKSAGGSTIRMGKLEPTAPATPSRTSPNGRLRPAPLSPQNRNLPGPEPYKIRKIPAPPEEAPAPVETAPPTQATDNESEE